jgi:hypothetical protein
MKEADGDAAPGNPNTPRRVCLMKNIIYFSDAQTPGGSDRAGRPSGASNKERDAMTTDAIPTDSPLDERRTIAATFAAGDDDYDEDFFDDDDMDDIFDGDEFDEADDEDFVDFDEEPSDDEIEEVDEDFDDLDDLDDEEEF